MKFEVLGPGCKNCDTLYDNVKKAIEGAGLTAKSEVKKIKDIDYFIKKGVFATPALILDGQVISTAKVLTPEQILELIRSKKATSNQH